MKKEHGFVALMSVLIISVVLFAAIFSVAQFGIMSRFTLLDLTRKSESITLAEACVHVARIDVVNDPSYTLSTSTTITVASSSCIIKSVTPNIPSSGKSRIVTSATSSTAQTNLQVDVNTSNGVFTQWLELTNS